MKWRLLDTGFATAAVNMAVDEAIMQMHGAGETPPTVRFYGWSPAAVSIGYFQRVAAEIDLRECRQRGIDVVRRLTGGRAVLHDAELTYSIVVRESFFPVPVTISASYRYFSQAIISGLRSMGIDAQMSTPRLAVHRDKRRPDSAACFDAPALYEITVNGRKLVGSAQVRKNGVILQHGSVLLQFQAADVASVLQLPDAGMRTKLSELLSRRAISAEEALGRPVSWQEMYEAIAGGFGPTLGVELEAGGLTSAETAISKNLSAVKYTQDCWNRRR